MIPAVRVSVIVNQQVRVQVAVSSPLGEQIPHCHLLLGIWGQSPGAGEAHEEVGPGRAA